MGGVDKGVVPKFMSKYHKKKINKERQTTRKYQSHAETSKQR
jgi:hypothetical protein